jgi:hypothetical protein
MVSYKTYGQFLDDVELIFINAITFNKEFLHVKESEKVYKAGTTAEFV